MCVLVVAMSTTILFLHTMTTSINARMDKAVKHSQCQYCRKIVVAVTAKHSVELYHGAQCTLSISCCRMYLTLGMTALK